MEHRLQRLIFISTIYNCLYNWIYMYICVYIYYFLYVVLTSIFQSFSLASSPALLCLPFSFTAVIFKLGTALWGILFLSFVPAVIWWRHIIFYCPPSLTGWPPGTGKCAVCNGLLMSSGSWSRGGSWHTRHRSLFRNQLSIR